MNVSHHFGEHAGIDVVEVAEDVYVPWHAVVGSDQHRIVLQRGFIIADADAASLVQMRDIDVVFALVSINDPVSGKTRGVWQRRCVSAPRQMMAARWRRIGRT